MVRGMGCWRLREGVENEIPRPICRRRNAHIRQEAFAVSETINITFELTGTAQFAVSELSDLEGLITWI